MKALNNIRNSIISYSKKNLVQLEKLRYNAYQLNNDGIDFENTRYRNDIRYGRNLVFGTYYNDELVSACYVSNSHGSLFVEELFTLKKYQSKGLYFGKKLLLYILENKHIVEEYFNTCLSHSSLYDKCDSIRSFYNQLGYKEVNDFMMIKRI